MPKFYAALPTKHDWKRDLGLAHKPSPFPAVERITKLLDEYRTLPGQQPHRRSSVELQDALTRQYIVFQIYKHAQYALKAKDADNKKKLGGVLNAEQLQAVLGLRDFAYSALKTALDTD